MSEDKGRRRVQEIAAAMSNLSGDLCELLDEIEQLSPHQPGAKEAADRLGPSLVKELRQMQGDLSNLAETVENHCGIVAYDGRGAKSTTTLTKREVFAAAALQGLVTNPANVAALRSTGGAARLVATAAVEYADALIAKLGEEQAAFSVEDKRPPFWSDDVMRIPERPVPPAEKSCDKFRGPRGVCFYCGWPAEKHANGGPTPDVRGCKGFQEDCCGDRCAFCLLSREAHEPEVKCAEAWCSVGSSHVRYVRNRRPLFAANVEVCKREWVWRAGRTGGLVKSAEIAMKHADEELRKRGWDLL